MLANLKNPLNYFSALRPRQKEVLTGICFLAVGFGWLAVAEAALRVQQYLAFGGLKNVEQSEKYHIDPETGLRLPVPGSRQGPIRINQLGFRGPDLAMPKPEEVVRVAFLGSSTTFDPFVKSFGDTWPARAVARLREAYPDCSFDLVNAGVPGMGTKSLSTYFKARVAATDPDIVVIWSSSLNAVLDDLAERQGIHEGPHYEASLLAETSLFWSKLEKNGVILRRKRAAFSDAGKVNLADVDLTTEYRADLRNLIERVRESGARPFLITMPGWLRAGQSRDTQLRAAETSLFYMPYVSIDGLLKARAKFDAAIRAVGSDAGVPVIDWTQAVPAEASFFVDSSHLSPAGAAVFGEYVGRRIDGEMGGGPGGCPSSSR